MSPNDHKDPSLSPEDAAGNGGGSLPDAGQAEGTAMPPDASPDISPDASQDVSPDASPDVATDASPAADGGGPSSAPLASVPPPNVPPAAPGVSDSHIQEDEARKDEAESVSVSSSQSRRAVGRGAAHAGSAGPDAGAGKTGVCGGDAGGERDDSGNTPPVWNMGWDGKPIEMPSVENAEGGVPSPARPEAAPSVGASAGREAEEGARAGNAKEDKAGKRKKSAALPRSGPFDGRSLGPVLHSEYMAVDPQTGVLTPQPRTVASRIYAVLAFFPLLPLLLIAAAQVAFSFDTRSLWCADETLLASLYEGVSSGPFRFGVYADGSPLADASPLYFWFLQGLNAIPGLSSLPGFSGPYVPLFLGSAASGLLLLLGGYALARYVARLDGRGALAAGILLLGSTGVSLALHAVQEHLFFAALVTFSHVLLYHALVREQSWFLMVAGFLLAGSAAMVGGAPGLILPLASCLFFLIWTGRVTRFFRLDFLFGLLTGVAVPAAWVYLVMRESSQSLDGPLVRAHADAVQGLWIGLPALSASWFYAPLALLAAWLPWVLLVLFLPWGRLFARKTREAVGLSRTPGLCGVAYMWCMALSGLAVLLMLGAKAPVYVVCLLPPLAALFGRAVLLLSPRAVKLFQLVLAILLFVLAALFLLLPILPFEIPFLPAVPGHLYFAGGVALLCALLLAFLVKPGRAEGLLLVMALFTAAVAYPLWVISIPTLESRMAAPAHAAEPVSGETPVAPPLAPSPGEESGGAVDGETGEEGAGATGVEQGGAESGADSDAGSGSGTDVGKGMEAGEESSGPASENAPEEAVAGPSAEETVPGGTGAPESGTSAPGTSAPGSVPGSVPGTSVPGTSVPETSVPGSVPETAVPAPSGEDGAGISGARNTGSPEVVEEEGAAPPVPPVPPVPVAPTAPVAPPAPAVPVAPPAPPAPPASADTPDAGSSGSAEPSGTEQHENTGENPRAGTAPAAL